MCWPGERPHYTSKRTGWPVAGAAGSCQGLSVETIGAIAIALVEQLMTGHCDCPPEDASPAHASDTRGVQALREHDKRVRATPDAARTPPGAVLPQRRSEYELRRNG